MLFWLGTAMAPSVATAPDESEPVILLISGQASVPGPLLPWPDDWCGSVCPGTLPDPAPDARLAGEPEAPETPVRSTAATAPRIVAPPPSPRPVEEWRSLVSAYFAASDVEKALAVISCESGGDPNAQNSRSGAAGLFQHIPRYWETRAEAIGLPGASIFDPVANVSAAAYLVYTEGWVHWAASARCWG
jgi:soluble lytic murein transglycosylase-like protein